MSNSCPPPEALRSYLNGKSADAETEILENHLASCQRCQVYLEIVSEESDSLMQLVADAASVPQVAGGVAGDSPSLSTGFVSHGQMDSPASSRSGAGDSTYMIRDYRILECIGQGGMGRVYRALHVKLNQQRAVKILKSDRMGAPEAISRFAREMKLLAQLEHRHIVRAFDAGEHDGLPYFVMEFISGINLNQLVRRLGPLPVTAACSIVRLAASALQYAHEQKVIHRDIKPSNLMITAEGDVKLLDLGLAQILEMEGDEAVSRADQVLGTLAYMSPEQLSGRRQVTPQSDIFSLGLTLHELLTGQRPFERPGKPPLLSDIRSVRPDVDENLDALVRDMTALIPSERPLSMTDVESRLNSISPAENLVGLVAEYYRWDKRTRPESNSEFAKADTQVGVARSSDSQRVSTPLGPLGVASPTTAPQFLGLWINHRIAAWLTGLVLVGTVVATGWLAAMEKIVFWPKSNTASVVDTTKGRIVVVADGKVGKQLLAERKIRVRGVKGDRHDVIEGESDLPVGKYRIVYDGPDELQQDEDEFDVYATETTRLNLNPVLNKLFQYPEIPHQAGPNATYHGTLWRSGWKESDQPLPFNIYLEVITLVTKPNFPMTKWLKIEVTSKGEEDYCETAFLHIDSKKWEAERFLDIREGWIVANSLAIEKHLNELKFDRGKNAEFIVRFDRKHDLIGETAGIPLPKQRLSIQDVCSLFFGQEMPSAGGEINSVRASLPSIGNRKASLEFVPDGRGGPVLCYVVSNRDQADDKSKPGFMMARRKSDKFNPFGFVKLEVNVPNKVVAECVIKNASVANPDVDDLYRRLEELRQNEFDLKRKKDKRPRGSIVPKASWLSDLAYNAGYTIGNLNSNSNPSGPTPPNRITPIPIPPSTTRFDIALIPSSPSSVTFNGVIKQNKDHSESITATIRMLGDKQIDGRIYRWIDLDVTSRRNEQDHWEAARLLVDAEAYNNSCDFLIQQGWIAYGNKETVFEIPSDKNLETLVDFRLQLQHKPDWNRIGVIDVLSMLFNADLKPRTSISSLRAEMAGKLAGMSRTAKPESFRHKSGQILNCERWEPPIYLPQFNYSFLRSSQIPFGFVTVTLNRDELSIGLDMDKHRSLLPTDVAASAFGTMDQLNARLQSNQNRLKPIPNSNWRVWTWSDAGKTYKAWAEFGGEIDPANGGDVLLRDTAELEIRVPKKLLSESDIAFIDAGRIWPSIDNRRRVLVEDNMSTNAFVFRIPGNAQKEDRYRDYAFKPVDIAWLDKLRAAKKLKPDRLKVIQNWQSFAGYTK